jgi:hypothetical protein
MSRPKIQNQVGNHRRALVGNHRRGKWATTDLLTLKSALTVGNVVYTKPHLGGNESAH